ncbi:rhodanese-like domain-containing protein [Leptolyngbya sp. AN02str]|uniref:rhodanese-like domain-containing protein n=1 Tax=Leptolyngbya sp. AN02str TaxID=3423363 RepID=UPI003D322584
MKPEFAEITVQNLAQRMVEADAQLQLIDVREPEELAVAKLDGFLNLPLSQYGEWASQIHTHLDPTAETIVLCHHGMRSAQMCQWLVSQGFTHVQNVVGGIDAYSACVDSAVPRY